MATQQPYAKELRELAEVLREAARLDPEAAMVRLGELLADSSDGTAFMTRLRGARRTAAQLAVDEAGSQAALARKLGVSQMVVSRALSTEPRRHR